MDVLRWSFWLIRGTLRLLFSVLYWLLCTVGGIFRSRLTSHGTARWASLFEIIRSGAFGRKGIIVGKLWGRFIRFRQEGFVMVFAPTRSGKGVSVVCPTLLDRTGGSVIVTDIKGENYAITSRARAAAGKVFTLNLMAPEVSDAFNPLDTVRIGTSHESDDAKQIADLLVTKSRDGEHWDEKARSLLSTLILYACHKYRDVAELRTLAQVRALAAQDWRGLESTLQDAAALGPVSLREEATTALAMEKSEELKSIKSNMDKATSLWSADKPAGMVSARSDFRFEQLNEEVATVYLMVPEEKLPIYGPVLRCFVGCALIAMTRAKETTPAVKTLLLLDEAAALGRISPLEDSIGFLASYMKIVMLWQDLDQLERTYPKARSILANAACKIAFAVSDYDTARMLADSIGYTTILSRSTGQSKANVDMVRHQLSEGASESARYLLDPSEIMRLSPDKALILMPRQVRYPILAAKVRYYRERRWHGRFDSWRDRPARPQPAKAIPRKARA